MDSDNDLSPDRRQVITWTIAKTLLIGPLSGLSGIGFWISHLIHYFTWKAIAHSFQWANRSCRWRRHGRFHRSSDYLSTPLILAHLTFNCKQKQQKTHRATRWLLLMLFIVDITLSLKWNANVLSSSFANRSPFSDWCLCDKYRAVNLTKNVSNRLCLSDSMKTTQHRVYCFELLPLCMSRFVYIGQGYTSLQRPLVRYQQVENTIYHVWISFVVLISARVQVEFIVNSKFNRLF